MPIGSSIENIARVLCKQTEGINLLNAWHLHVYVKSNGLELHASVGNPLVSMFVQAGSISVAWNIFDRLVSRDECSWNALIRGYVRCGDAARAVSLYEEMQEHLQPDRFTYIAAIGACTELKDVERGKKLHAEVASLGWLKSDRFVANSMIDMYVKCGILASAQEVFDQLQTRDIVAWNALIAGLAKDGCANKTLLACLERMQGEGVSPDAVTYVCSLNGCGGSKSVRAGLELHAEVVTKGLLETNMVVCNALVDMYVKCGSLMEAQHVFDSFPSRDVITWNTLIAGYAKNGLGDEALTSFDRMQQAGISPNAVSFVCSLNACCSMEATGKGTVIHAEICRKGFLERNHLVGNAMVDFYAQCGSLDKAREVFDKLPKRNVVTWTTLIGGYAKYERGEEALMCFDQMEVDGVSPNAATFICGLQACGSIEAVGQGICIHIEMTRQGLVERDLAVGNAILDMYIKCGALEKAKEVFDKLPDRDMIAWTALVAGYAKLGRGEKALQCYEQMQHEGLYPNSLTYVQCLNACGSIAALEKGGEIHAQIATEGLLQRDLVVGNALVDMYAKCGLLAKAQEAFDSLPTHDVVSWTVLIAGYAEHDLAGAALTCFQKMQLNGFTPNSATYIPILKACGDMGAIDKGRRLHEELASKGFLEDGLFIGNALIDMYAKSGALTKAQELFHKLPTRDVVSWTTLASGYIQWGESRNVFEVFDTMERQGILPDLVTFVSVLSVCSRIGLMEKGQALFHSISEEYCMTPRIEHHTCIADLFSRSGHLHRALAVLEKLPCDPDPVLLRTFLDACRKWGNVEIGRKAFEYAMRLVKDRASGHGVQEHNAEWND